jgi:hypothetical protein
MNRPLQSASNSPVKEENKHSATKARGYKLFEKVREKQKLEDKQAKENAADEDYLGYQQEFTYDTPYDS